MRKTVVSEIERGLLGVASRSFAHRVEEDGWTREDADASCWRCASGVGAHEVDGDGCATCRGQKIVWDRAVRLGAYSDEVIQRAVLELKYAGWRRSGAELGWALGTRLGEALKDAGIDPGLCAVVPVPMPWGRRMVRGVDHTLVLARGVSSASGTRVVRALAARHHRRQVGLGATERAKNIRGGFRCVMGRSRLRRALSGVRVVVLVDDVMTTGATLEHAARALRGALGSAFLGDEPGVWVAVAGARGDRSRRGAAGPAPYGGQGLVGAQIPQEV